MQSFNMALRDVGQQGPCMGLAIFSEESARLSVVNFKDFPRVIQTTFVSTLRLQVERAGSGKVFPSATKRGQQCLSDEFLAL